MKNKEVSGIIAFLLFSCGIVLTVRSGPLPNAGRLLGQDTVKKDIPMEQVDRKGTMAPVGYYNDKIDLDKKLGLGALENGFDSLCIRLWYGYSNAVDTLQLVTIQYTAGRWRARLSLLPMQIDHKTGKVIPIKQITKDAVPRSGWKTFSGSLLAHHILTLPDMRKIRDYPNMTGGGASVTIEVASPRLYRIYSYSYPKLATGVPQARDIESILKLVREQLGFKQLKKI